MSIKSPTGSKNPFYDPEDDVNDDTFVNYRSRAYDNAENDLYERRRQELLDERRKVENRLLHSSSAVVRTIYETEKIGVDTAEELVRQGEQLKNVDRNLDEINNITKGTQKHLTAMKSMFSGFKSYFGRSNNAENSSSQKKSLSPTEQSPNALTRDLKRVKEEAEMARQNIHSGARSRFDTSGFNASSAFNDDKLIESGLAEPGSLSEDLEQRFNENLTQIASGVSRLKGLAQGLSTELDEQLDLINIIDNKTDRADQTIQFQTNQINRILKK